MESKTLIILSSTRKDSNTKLLAQQLFTCIETDTLDLLDHKIAHYDYKGRYPETDEFLQVMEKVLQYNTIVFATPVYWYSMSALLKIFFDRLTDIVTIEKQVGRKLKGKNIFLVSVGTDPELPTGFDVPFKLTAEYLDMHFIDSYYCSTKEVNEKLKHTTEFLKKINITH